MKLYGIKVMIDSRVWSTDSKEEVEEQNRAREVVTIQGIV